MGVVAGVALLALPVAFITLPVWLPIHWYFTNVWHADERAKRAAAELETRNLMDACANPHFRRKEDHWWRGAP